jgi:hypothetical protein
MKVEPSARELLEVARASLVSEVIALLPESQRYPALMAANALAIAARDLASEPGTAAELERIAALLGEPVPAGGEAELPRATARLATRVRMGQFDAGAPRANLLAHLRATTRQRLAVSNPRLLRESSTTP